MATTHSEARVVRYHFGPCVFTPAERELRYGSIVAAVPMQESIVLQELLTRPCEVVSKAELAAVLWPDDRYGDFDRAIHNLISKLRKLHPKGARWIVTIPKVGYKLDLAVTCEELAPAPDQIQTNRITPAAIETPNTPSAPAPHEETPAARQTVVQSAIESTEDERSGSASLPVEASLQIGRWSSLLIFASFVLALAGGFSFWKRHQTAPPYSSLIKVGVLPFTDTGGRIGEADTLREQLNDALAALPTLEVRAAHSLTPAMAVKGVQTVGQQLNLDLLIAGTYEARDENYSLNLELIRSRDGAHLTSLHYEGARSALGMLPDRITASLAPLIQQHHGEAGAQRILGSTTSEQAYELAFRANTLLLQRSRSEVEQAIALYREAVALDPRYAKAWAGLSESELVLANFGTGPATNQTFEEARKSAQQALTLEPTMAQAHSTLGFMLLQHDWRLGEAEQQLRLAVNNNPGMAANHLRLAVLLSDEGRNAEAESEIERAREVDPQWTVINGTAMFVHIMARKYEKAIADAEALVTSKPDWSRAHQHLGWALWYAGKHTLAIRQWMQAALLEQDAQEAKIQEDGLKLLEQHGVRAYAEYRLDQHAKGVHEDDFVAAEWYAFAGNREKTLQELAQMVESHNPESLKVPANPAYDFLRAEPRFRDLVDQLKRARS